MYDWLDGYLRAMPGAEHDYKIEWRWDRYKVRGKLFAVLCCPGPEYKVYGGHPLVNLKCDPRLAEGLRAQYPEILPGFYCDKRTWIAVLLDGAMPGGALRELCGLSYRLAVERLPKYVQRELDIERFLI
ncbi:MAG TPA: MmcQ/YjbR family DNA-binding protein [Candidatus Intestinimonas stercoravium]|uniref:MmcQ/YjbR family DNA-binding protein n=1 Tax=uncultured Intestinimonas sp. TaxID=1689265 RepID=UPI001F90B57B|nr:MmcQ/YjbR family DNA-binding protein [uncultured Intestinimonas sp.]HJA63469.1 MmcQ/YjbR family DNA-binding protein [Candidatus Intestinimonas stercoravium]